MQTFVFKKCAAKERRAVRENQELIGNKMVTIVLILYFSQYFFRLKVILLKVILN